MLTEWQVLGAMGVARDIVDRVLTCDDTPRNIHQSRLIFSQVENALNNYFALKEQEKYFADSCKLTKESVDDEI